MPNLAPFIVTGLALGGVYALSGVGIVVLYRATGVLNFAYGAIGAMGALIAWNLVRAGVPLWAAVMAAIAVGGALSLGYGLLVGPPLARRDPLVKAMGTLGFALILVGIMFLVWSDDPRTLELPTTKVGIFIGSVRVTWTGIIAVGLAIVVSAGTALFLRRSDLGTVMRALADDRDVTAMLGVPVRRVEAAAWLGSGLVCGATGVLLASLVLLDGVTLTFLVISSLAAALVGRLRSLSITFAAGLLIGVVESTLTAVPEIAQLRAMTPFVVAIVVLVWLGRGRMVTISAPGSGR
jgi:branched-chain amino acid transport system permease protein